MITFLPAGGLPPVTLLTFPALTLVVILALVTERFLVPSWDPNDWKLSYRGSAGYLLLDCTTLIGI